MKKKIVLGTFALAAVFALSFFYAPSEAEAQGGTVEYWNEGDDECVGQRWVCVTCCPI